MTDEQICMSLISSFPKPNFLIRDIHKICLLIVAFTDCVFYYNINILLNHAINVKSDRSGMALFVRICRKMFIIIFIFRK